MRIAYVGEGDDLARWDEYVGPRTSAVTDLAGWRLVVRDAYGIGAHFLVALDNDERCVGALGLYQIRHPIFGHYLSTAVFGNDGGLHFDDSAARDALVAEAKALAVRLKVAYLVIRTRGAALDGFEVDRHYRTALVDLSGGADALWNRLPNKTRNQVRRGTKEGFTLHTGHSQMLAFFDVFHEHMRDLGSPAHSRRYYDAIVNHLGHCADFLVLRDGQQLAAGALLFWTNGTAMNSHTVALRRFNKRCPNYLIYWKMLEASVARGCTRFDMGRSEAGSSNLQFKSNWGTTELPLYYNYFLVTARTVPYVDPRNPKYRIAIAAWQKMPLALTRLLGPRLISGVA
jgi:FemAB-related protein (PEP-CTERM system-associated)